MDKAKIIEKLELLTGLIDKTEPDIPSDKALFSHHIIKNQENIIHISNSIRIKNCYVVISCLVNLKKNLLF